MTLPDWILEIEKGCDRRAYSITYLIDKDKIRLIDFLKIALEALEKLKSQPVRGYPDIYQTNPIAEAALQKIRGEE